MSFLSANLLNKSTVLVTGGASGIGFALSKKFVALGHKVIVVGRRESQLSIAKNALPSLITIQGDLSTDTGRLALHKTVTEQHPEVNVLINNAGVSFMTEKLKDSTANDWGKYKAELLTNLEAPIHLSTLFAPHFVSKDHAMIANITSVLAFFQLTFVPVYCATKAGLHSFTMSLRHQLKDTSVHVVEIIPPAVATDMYSSEDALDPDVYAEDVMRQLLEGKNVEIGYNSDKIIRGNRDYLDKMTVRSTERLEKK